MKIFPISIIIISLVFTDQDYRVTTGFKITSARIQNILITDLHVHVLRIVCIQYMYFKN